MSRSVSTASVITRVRVPVYIDVDVGGQIMTLYPIEVMYENGKIRKLSKRYSDVLRFHKEVLKGASHPALEGFNFPHKSMFNTSAEFTKERRRSGFEEYFELLLRLGPSYAPFIATFLKDDDDAFDELGSDSTPSSRFVSTSPANGKPRYSPRTLLADNSPNRLGFVAVNTTEDPQSQDAFGLARPKSAAHWLGFFYAPIFCFALVYTRLLTALGAIHASDWSSGAAWLAIFSSPLVMSVAFALLAPICDGDPESSLPSSSSNPHLSPKASAL